MELFHKMISGFLGIPERQISSTLHLLGEGATIPFISRYRKEATGGLDEVQIEQIKEQQTERNDSRHHQRAGKTDCRTGETYQRHLESDGTGRHLSSL